MTFSSVARRFSYAACYYEREASLQLEIAKKLSAFLVPSMKFLSILELGCGTGFLTGELIQCYPKAKIDALDFAPGMIEQAQLKFADERQISWIIDDVRIYQPKNGRYDLLVSSSAFHWMHPQRNLFQHLRALIREEGKLVFSLMLHGTLAELHELRKKVTPKKPFSLILPRSEEILSDLKFAQWKISEWKEERTKITFPSTQRLMHSIHRLGLTGQVAEGSKNLLTRTELRKLQANYQQLYSNPKGEV